MNTQTSSIAGVCELLDKLHSTDAQDIIEASKAEEAKLIRTIEPEPELLNPMEPDFESEHLNMDAAGFKTDMTELFDAYMASEPIYLTGWTGGGKTTIARALVDMANADTLAANRATFDANVKAYKAGTPEDQLAGYKPLRYTLKMFQGHEETRAAELVGETGFVYTEDGNRAIVDVPGAALDCYVNGYTLLVDEGDAIPSGVHSQCHGLFDKRVNKVSFWLNGRKDFKKHPDYRVIFTGNTKGENENAVEYVHSQPQSKALMNRMAFVVNVGYMQKFSEQALLLKRVPGADKDVVGRMIDCSNNVRQLYKEGAIGLVISTRDIEAWLRNVQRRAERDTTGSYTTQEFWSKIVVPAAGPTVLNKTSDEGAAEAAAREFSWR